MRLISRLKDKLRNLAGIRRERQIPPPGEKPPIGSNIVREKLRMRLKFPISDELWKFFTVMGWRAIDMRYNNRRYTIVPDKILLKFIKADDIERHALHARLVKVNRHGASSRTASSSDTPPLQPLPKEIVFENTVAD